VRKGCSPGSLSRIVGGYRVPESTFVGKLQSGVDVLKQQPRKRRFTISFLKRRYLKKGGTEDNGIKGRRRGVQGDPLNK